MVRPPQRDPRMNRSQNALLQYASAPTGTGYADQYVDQSMMGDDRGRPPSGQYYLEPSVPYEPSITEMRAKRAADGLFRAYNHDIMGRSLGEGASVPTSRLRGYNMHRDDTQNYENIGGTTGHSLPPPIAQRLQSIPGATLDEKLANIKRNGPNTDQDVYDMQFLDRLLGNTQYRASSPIDEGPDYSGYSGGPHDLPTWMLRR